MTQRPDHPTPQAGAAVAASIEEMLSQQRRFADQIGATGTVAHFAAGRPWHTAPLPRIILPPGELTLIVHTAAVGKMWRSGSQIACLVDPTLTEQFMGAPSDILPTGVFRQLPYADPLVVFSVPISCRTTDDRPARLLGFFVYGLMNLSTVDAAFCDIYTKADTLGVTAVLELTDGGPGGHELNRLAIPLDVDQLTLSQYVTEAARSHPLDIATALHATDESLRACLETLIRPILGALLYLCTKDADIDDPDDRPGRSRHQAARKRRTRKATNLVPVGWRIGARLRHIAATTCQTFQATADTPGTGRTHPPRQRRCHFKTVWTDVGRTVPRTVFVLPYFIHKDQIGLSDTESTLVPATGRKPRRSRARRTQYGKDR